MKRAKRTSLVSGRLFVDKNEATLVSQMQSKLMKEEYNESKTSNTNRYKEDAFFMLQKSKIKPKLLRAILI